MKKTTLFYALALALAVLFLLASFVGVAWYSDDRGLVFQIEMNIGTKNGAFSTLADVVFTLSPVLALIALFFLPSAGEGGKKVCLFLHTVPVALYSLMELLLFLFVKEGHFSLVITYLAILLLSALVIGAALLPDLRGMAAAGCLFYVGLEIVLCALSLVFKEKFSTFVFSQLLPFSKTSTLHVTYVVISMFLYFASFALSLFFHLKALPRESAPFTEE